MGFDQLAFCYRFTHALCVGFRLGESTQTAADAQQEVQAQKRRHVMLEKQLGKVKVEQSTGRTSGEQLGIRPKRKFSLKLTNYTLLGIEK